MPRYIQTVVTRPVAGRAAEFDRWYEEVHLPEVLAVPGFVAGRRYRQAGADADEEPARLAVYEIETDDLAVTLAALVAASAGMTTSEAMDPAATTVAVYEPLHGDTDGRR